jgi:hypothetical protein
MKERKSIGSQVVGASVNYSPEFLTTEPNLNLLRRITDSSGGKILNLDDSTINPFEHDRRKTHQPKDLWEWLLKLAVIMFVLDVGVRRIQLDREEIARAVRAIRRKLFFWEGIERAPEAEESLASLLARRDQVRAKQTAPTVEPRADLFRPDKPVTIQQSPGPAAEEPAADQAEPATQPQPDAPPPVATTSRLLEAKRRALKRNQ